MPIRALPNGLTEKPAKNATSYHQGSGKMVTWPPSGCSSNAGGAGGLELESGVIVADRNASLAPNYQDAATVCYDAAIALADYPLELDVNCDGTIDATDYACHDSTMTFDVGTGDLRNAIRITPPSWFSGTIMRSFVAALYGSGNPNFRPVVVPDELGVIVAATLEILTEDGGDWGDPTLRISLDNSYNSTHSIYKYHVGTKLEYYLLRITAGTVEARKMKFHKCGYAIKEILAASGIPPEVATTVQAENLMFADYAGLCAVKSDAFSIAYSFAPLAYGWHGNDDGSEFQIVHFNEGASYWGSALGVLNLAISKSGTPTASYVGEAAKNWRPRRTQDIFWQPTAMRSLLNVNLTLEIATPDGWPDAFNAGDFYVIWDGSTFKKMTYTVDTN